MNENDLRDALRTVVTSAATPPPMNSAPVVAAGRRAVRRRAAVIGAGAAVAVVATSALVAGPLLGHGGGGTPFGAAGAPPTGTLPAPRPANTKPSWPAGPDGKPQEDATATVGPRYERGKLLQERVLAAVPDGWTAPTGTAVEDLPLRDHQAMVEGTAWHYQASVTVARNGRSGRLLVEVRTVDDGLPTEPCALARAFWGMGGDCQVRTVKGEKVGVVVQPGSDDRFDQWAAYRHRDGVVVHVAQSRRSANIEDAPSPLTELPLTVQQLADLATGEQFHLR